MCFPEDIYSSIHIKTPHVFLVVPFLFLIDEFVCVHLLKALRDEKGILRV